MKPSPQELRLAELEIRNRLAGEGSAIEPRAGSLTARQRIAHLLDEGTFVETGKLVTHRSTDFGIDQMRVPGDGVITGHGKIHNRPVFVYAQDATVFGGSLSEANAAKIVAAIDTATRIKVPVLGILDSVGLRIEDSVDALAGLGDILASATAASGKIPQVSILLGPPSEPVALIASLSDLIVAEEGAQAQTTSLIAPGDTDCLEQARKLLCFLPSSHLDVPPRQPNADDPTHADLALDSILPDSPDAPYNVLDVLTKVVDTGSLFELQPHHASNLVTAFARMDGRPVGIAANQPAHLGGILDHDAACKAAHFVRLCDAFHLPILTFVDTPGFDPAGLSAAAHLASAYACATTPKLTVILRRANGPAYAIMGSKHLGADLNLAWPTAEMAVLPPADAVNLIHRREFEDHLKHAQSVWPQGMAFSEAKKDALLADLRNDRTTEFRDRFAHPYRAAERGFLDAVIRPGETRRCLNQALDLLASKPK